MHYFSLLCTTFHSYALLFIIMHYFSLLCFTFHSFYFMNTLYHHRNPFISPSTRDKHSQSSTSQPSQVVSVLFCRSNSLLALDRAAIAASGTRQTESKASSYACMLSSSSIVTESAESGPRAGPSERNSYWGRLKRGGSEETKKGVRGPPGKFFMTTPFRSLENALFLENLPLTEAKDHV